MDNELILSTGAVGFVCAHLVEFVKNSRAFPWLSQQTETINRVVGVVVAGVASIGVHVTFDQEAGALLITGLTMTAIGHGLWQWVTQWAVQQFAYKTTIAQNSLLNAVAALIGQLQTQQRVQATEQRAIARDVKDVKDEVTP